MRKRLSARGKSRAGAKNGDCHQFAPPLGPRNQALGPKRIGWLYPIFRNIHFYPGLLLLLTLLGLTSGSAQQEAKILRPENGAALPSGELSVVATAPGGQLELDGQAIPAEEPFPNVFHGRTNAAAGEHTLALVWEGGREEIRFYVGGDPPAGFKPFRLHPPVATACTHCHGLSRRGRFRFTGGCFACHQQETFAGVHDHPPHMLEECGQCHNAHGSTAEALLALPREKACKLCHN